MNHSNEFLLYRNKLTKLQNVHRNLCQNLEVRKRQCFRFLDLQLNLRIELEQKLESGWLSNVSRRKIEDQISRVMKFRYQTLSEEIEYEKEINIKILQVENEMTEIRSLISFES